MKKTLSLVLILSMLLSILAFPFNAFAKDIALKGDNGICRYEYYPDNKTLVIKSKDVDGANLSFYKYGYPKSEQYYGSFTDNIPELHFFSVINTETIVFEHGVNDIIRFFVYGSALSCVKRVFIPTSVEYIEDFSEVHFQVYMEDGQELCRYNYSQKIDIYYAGSEEQWSNVHLFDHAFYKNSPNYEKKWDYDVDGDLDAELDNFKSFPVYYNCKGTIEDHTDAVNKLSESERNKIIIATVAVTSTVVLVTVCVIINKRRKRKA